MLPQQLRSLVTDHDRIGRQHLVGIRGQARVRAVEPAGHALNRAELPRKVAGRTARDAVEVGADFPVQAMAGDRCEGFRVGHHVHGIRILLEREAEERPGLRQRDVGEPARDARARIHHRPARAVRDIGIASALHLDRAGRRHAACDRQHAAVALAVDVGREVAGRREHVVGA